MTPDAPPPHDVTCCVFCGIQPGTVGNLLVHLLEKHTAIFGGVAKCVGCDTNFSTNSKSRLTHFREHIADRGGPGIYSAALTFQEIYDHMLNERNHVMTPDGQFEGDVCLICGKVMYVSKKYHHLAILNHVIESHFRWKENGWSNEKTKCWCGFVSPGDYNKEDRMRKHLSEHRIDLNMTFPSSVDALWAHYHAALLGVELEAK